MSAFRQRISTAFVESTVTQLVSKRFVKKQQMQWTPRGAYLLLQIHTQTLNDNRSRRFGNGTLRSGVLLHYPGLIGRNSRLPVHFAPVEWPGTPVVHQPRAPPACHPA